MAMPSVPKSDLPLKIAIGVVAVLMFVAVVALVVAVVHEGGAEDTPRDELLDSTE
jgi:hypothetical protein